MATIRELQASFVAKASGMKSAIQGVKKDINSLQSASDKTTGKMSKDFTKSTSNIGKTVGGISKNFHSMSVAVQKSFDSIGKSIQSAGTTLESWGSSIQQTGKNATKVLSPLTAFYATAAITGGKRMLENEQLDILMKNTFRTADAYEQAWDSVNRLTKGTAFMNSDVGGWLSQLVQSNIELDKSEEIMKSILDFSVGSGQIGIEGEIYDVIMKAVRAGGWDQMTLDMLAQRGLNLAGHVANILGITTESAQEMLKDGTISMTESLDYFVDAVQVGSEGAGGYFASMADSAQKGGETMAGAWVNTKAALAQLGEDMWKSGAWDALKDALNNITDFLYQLAPALEPMAKAIASIMATMVDWVQKLMTAFINLRPKTQALIASLSVIGAVLGPAIFMFGSFVGAVGKALKPFGALFRRMSTVLEIINGKGGLKGALRILASRFSFLAGPIGIAISLFTLLYSTSKTFREAFHNMIVSIIDFGKKIYDWMKPAIDTVVDSFKVMMGSFKGAGGGLDSLGAAFAPLLDIIGFLVKAIMSGLAVALGLIMPLISGVVRAIGPLIKTISSLISIVVNLGMAILSVFMLDFSKAMDYFKAAFQSAIDFFMNLWGVFAEFFKGFITTLVAEFGLLSGSWVKLGDIAKVVWNGIISLTLKVKDAFLSLLGLLGGVGTAIGSAFKSVISFFTGIVLSINETMEKVDKAILSALINTFKAVGSMITQLGSSIAKWFMDSFVGGLNDGLSSVGDSGNKIVESLIEGIRQGLQNIGDIGNRVSEALVLSFSNVGEKISDAISEGLNNKVGDLVKGYFGSIIESFKSFGGIVSLVAPSLIGVGARMLGLTGPIGLIISIVTTLISTFVKLYKSNEDVRNVVADTWKGIQGVFSDVWKSLEPIFNELQKAFSEVAEELGPEFAKTKEVIVDSFNELKPTFKELGETFAELGKVFSEIFVELGEVFGEIVVVFSDVFKELGEVLSELVVMFVDVFKEISQVVAEVVKTIIPIWIELQLTLVSTIGEIVKVVIPALLQVFKTVFPMILDIVKSVISIAVEVFTMLIDVVLDIAKTVLPLLISVITALLPIVLDVVKSVLTVAITIFTSLIDVVLELAKTIIPMILTVVKAVLPMVLGIVKAVLPMVISIFTMLIDVVMSLVKAVLPVILSVVKSVFPMILSIIKAVLPIVVNLITSVVDVILTLAKTVIPLVLNVIQMAFPIIQKIIEIAMKIAVTALKLLVGVIQNVVVPAIEFILKVVQTVFPVITKVIEGALNIVIGILDFFVALFTGNWSGMWDAVKKILSGATSIIWSVIKGVFDLIALFIKTTFNAISSFFSMIWSGITTIFKTVISAIYNFVKERFTALKNTTTTIFTAVWNFLRSIWNTVLNFIIDIIQKLFTRFVTGWTNIFNKTKSVFTAVWNFLRDLWNKTLSFITNLIKTLFNRIRDRWNNILNTTKSIFNTVWDFLRGIWKKVKNYIFDTVSGIFTKVKDTWTDLKTRTTEIFGGIYDSIKEKFDDIVDAAKKLPGRIGDGIKNMAEGVKKGVKEVVNFLASGLEDGINGVIDGINTATGWIGVKKNINHVSIPGYAHGTDAHPGGLARVSDGKGSNSGRELIQTPDGQSFLSPKQESIVDLPRGTQVLPAKLTKEIIPEYAFGIGKKIKKGYNTVKDGMTAAKTVGKAGVEKGAKAVKDTAVNVYDYIKSPDKLLDKALSMLGVTTPDGGGFAGGIIKAGFKKVKDAGVDFVKEKLNVFDDGPAPIGNASGWRQLIFKAAGMMGQSVSSGELNGIIKQIQRESGGNQSIVQSKAVRDINTLMGNPARGLLQYIPQTFGAYKVPGHGNINSGYDQLLAFFNNKNWRRDLPYGKRGWGPTGAKHYADGEFGIDTKQLAWIADGGWAESIISHDPGKKARSQKIWQQTGDTLGFTDNKGNKEILFQLERIARAVESETDLSIIMNDRLVGEMVEPHVTNQQDRKRFRKIKSGR